jgi:hypothetical protein
MFTMHGTAWVEARRFFSVAAIVLTCATVADAQAALTGKWQGETNGGAVLELDLTVKGTVLTGTLTRNDVSTVISEGTVVKNTFTFKAKVSEQVEGFSGELVDNHIRVWLDRQGAETAIVLNRVKSASDSGFGTRGSRLARVVAFAP